MANKTSVHDTYIAFVFRFGFHFGWTCGYGNNADRYSIYWVGLIGFCWGQEGMLERDLG